MRVFTDGACKSNGKAQAQAAYAGWFPDQKDWSFARKMPDNELQTNQRAELKAIHDSVLILYEKCPPDTSIKIYTDSIYSKNCLTTWITGWIKKGWKTSDGEPVKHKDLIEPTADRLKKFKEYSIVYVKAHTGLKDDLSINNDVVDKMATGILTDTPKQIIDRDEDIMKDLPLSLMGPPLEGSKIVDWCKTHLELLDTAALNSALFSAFKRTVEKNGYSLDVQVINKNKVVRVTRNLIKDSKITG
jgi:ribonuclease HI